MKNTGLMRGCAAVALSATLGLPAYGQTVEVDEIIVTATKRAESLQDVPVAVTALSGDLLNDVGVGAVENLAAIAPSVTFTQSTNDQNNSVNIRGIGTSVFSQGVEPSVSIVVDDVVLARQAIGFQDLVDIQQVEVLRGPQSTLFGKNASAGVIAVTTQDPSAEMSGRIDLTATDDGEYGLGASLSGPLSDTIGGRLTGYYKEFDGHIDNNDGRDLNGYENWGLRGKLLFEPTDAFGLTLIGDYRKSDQDCCIYVLRDTSQAANPAQAAGLAGLVAPVQIGVENADASVGAPVFNDSEQWGVSAKAEYEFGDGFTATSITAFRDYDFVNNIDVDATALADPIPGFITFDLNSGTTGIQQFSQEFRLTSPQNDRFDYVLGAYAFLLDIDRTFQRRFEIAIPIGGGNIFQINQSGRFNATVDTTNLAAFASGNVYLGDKTTVFGGLRVIYEELDYTVDRDPANVLVPGDRPFGGVTGTRADIDDGTNDTALTGEVGLRYDFTEDVQSYIRYARGYKGKAIDSGFGAQATVQPIDPETSDAFEAGLKTRLADGRATLNIALFHTEFDNFQEQGTVLAQDANSVLNAEVLLTNVGSVETTGIEVELLAQLSENTTLQGGVSVTDATITDFPNSSCYFGQTAAQGCVPVVLSDNGTPGDPTDDIVSNLQDASGTRLPNAPAIKMSATLRQVVPLETSFDGFVQLNMRTQSETNFSLAGDPATSQRAYTIFNLSAGLTDDDGDWTATVFVNNLTDQFYASNIFRDPLYRGVLSQYVPRDHSRYFGGRLTANF
ncbi:MAG: TonB-dependent receptor [Pseudomonadota bacterium]